MTQSGLAPVKASVTVHQRREVVFDVFIEEFGDWWPLAMHSLGGDEVATAVIEPRVGGRVFERRHDGTESPWAEVLVFDRPERIVLSWQPNPTRPAPTEVEFRFETVGRDGHLTLVRVVHRNWDVLGNDALGVRDSYERGWPGILARLGRQAADVECVRAHAVAANQETWAWLAREDRTPDDDEAMLNAAHASLHHWTRVGEPVHRARGEWLVSHVYAVLGRGEPARHHAARCLGITEKAGLEDFDLAYAYEGMARAAAASGDRVTADAYRAKAAEAGRAIAADEDRAIFEADLAAEPWSGEGPQGKAAAAEPASRRE